MTSLPAAASPAVRRLALGVSRAGSMRRTTPAATTMTTTTTRSLTTTSAALAMKIPRHARKLAELRGEPAGPKQPTKKIKQEPTVNPPGHGETIWIHNHTYKGHVLFSFDRVMDSKERLRQMPYTGKKLVPAKLRKDYWEPMAMIRLPAGLGAVGRSVYHALRELKKRHELEWGRHDPEEEERMLKMTKEERGAAINDQRANVVADVAAVLGGLGRGNKMWMLPWGDEWEERGLLVRRSPTSPWVRIAWRVEEPDSWRLKKLGCEVGFCGGRDRFVDWKSLMGVYAIQEGLLVEGRVMEKEELERFKALHPVKVYWNEHNPHYQGYAREWTDNVEHVVGLGKARKPRGFMYPEALWAQQEARKKTEEPMAEAA